MQGPLSINIPTSDAKTTIPRFDTTIYHKFRFAGAKQDSVEGKGDKITFEYHLVDPAAAEGGGEPILPGAFGSKVFDTVFLYGKDTEKGKIPTWATTQIAKVQDGFLGTGDKENKAGKPVRPDLGPECVAQMMGQVAFLKFKNPTGDRTSQDVTEIKFPGDMPQA